MSILKYLIIYFVIINCIAFCLYGIDKRRAKLKQWRISELNLLTVAFIGGSIGALLGMKMFHHKTKHIKFLILVPIFLILHIMIIAYIF